MSTRRVRYVVELDNASARRAAQQLAAEIEKAIGKVDLAAGGSGGSGGGGGGSTAAAAGAAAATAEAKKKTKELTSQQQISKRIESNLVGAFAAFASVKTASVIAETTYELGRAAEEAQNLETAFQDAFTAEGTDPDKLLTRLRVASKGMASDFDLMSQALRALRLGVTSDTELMGRLLEIATKRGQEFGRSTADAFNDIALGVGRLSPRILDNLGFLVKVDDAYQTYADTMGIVKSEMTTFDQRQAILNEILKQAADDGAALVNEYEQLRAAKTNLARAAGSAINSLTPFPDMLGDTAGSANILADNISKVVDGFDEIRSREGSWTGSMRAVIGEMNNWEKAASGLALLIPFVGPAMAMGLFNRGAGDAAVRLGGSPYGGGPDMGLSRIPGSAGPLTQPTWGDIAARNARNVPRDQNVAAYMRSQGGGASAGAGIYDIDAIREAEREAERAAKKWSGGADKVEDAWVKTAETVMGKWVDLLEKVPGLFGTSPVTQEQLDLAEMGVPQNFADNYLRRLKDEVLNNKDWEGVDIGSAASALGIDGGMDPKAILAQFEAAWKNSSLFSNPENLSFIDVEAVQEYMKQQADAEKGKENLRALFGVGDNTEELKALGFQIYDPVSLGVEEAVLAPDGGAYLGQTLMDSLYQGFVAGGEGKDWLSAIVNPYVEQVKAEIYAEIAGSIDG